MLLTNIAISVWMIIIPIILTVLLWQYTFILVTMVLIIMVGVGLMWYADYEERSNPKRSIKDERNLNRE